MGCGQIEAVKAPSPRPFLSRFRRIGASVRIPAEDSDHGSCLIPTRIPGETDHDFCAKPISDRQGAETVIGMVQESAVEMSFVALDTKQGVA